MLTWAKKYLSAIIIILALLTIFLAYFNRHYYYNKRAEIALSNKDNSNAKKYAQQSLLANKNQAEPWAVLSVVDAKAGDYESAIIKARTAYNIHQSPKAYSLMGKYFLGANMIDSAEYYMKRSLELNGDTILVSLGLMIVYSRKKDMPQAITFFDITRRNDPKSFELKETKDENGSIIEKYYTRTTENGNVLKNGLYSSYYSNGNPKIQVFYLEGRLEGLLSKYYDNGQLEGEISYKFDTVNGPTKTWHKNGQLAKERAYLNGELSGPFTEWDSNGNKFVQGKYLKGEKDGFYKEWYENGQQSIEGSYKMGNKDGQWTTWYSNGNIGSRCVFKNGFEEGRYVEFWDNGQKMKEGYYNKGIPDTNWTYWNSSGNIIKSDEMNVLYEKLKAFITHYPIEPAQFRPMY